MAWYLYHVDRMASDVGGGVYFRTHAGQDGIGPGTMSHGFAYRPNPIFGPWYNFAVSNDW